MPSTRIQSVEEKALRSGAQDDSVVNHTGLAEPFITLATSATPSTVPTKIITLKLKKKALIVRLKIAGGRLAGFLNRNNFSSVSTIPSATTSALPIPRTGVRTTKRHSINQKFIQQVIDFEPEAYRVKEEDDATYESDTVVDRHEFSTPVTRSKSGGFAQDAHVISTVSTVRKSTKITKKIPLNVPRVTNSVNLNALIDTTEKTYNGISNATEFEQSKTITELQVTTKRVKTVNKEFVINRKRPYIFDWTPFQDHESPTLEQCETVGTILADWAAVQTPKIDIPRDPEAFMIKATGVAGPLHAGNDKTVHGIFETILSQATGNGNAIAVRNLVCEKFPFKNGHGQWVVGKKPNYHAIRKAHVDQLIDAMGAGGLQNGKAKDFKTILDVVYEKNCADAGQILPDHNEPGAPDFVDGSLSLAYLDKLDMEDLFFYLVGLPRIGVKTAACILQFNYRFPILAVDTHVFRLAHLLGWIPSELDAGRDRNLAAMHLDFHVPEDLKWRIHQGFWHHGQLCYKCTAKADPKSKEWAECVCPLDELKVRQHMVAAKPRKRKLKVEEQDEDAESLPKKPKRQPTLVAYARMTAEEAQEAGYRLAQDEINDSFMAGTSTGRSNFTKEHTYWVKVTGEVIRD